MRNRFLTGLALTVSILFGAPPALAGDEAPTALIARKDLFGNPVKAGAAISPDGKWISWLAPREGVMNVFVGPKDHPRDGFFVTSEKRRVTSYHWAYSSSHLLFMQDENGDENWHIFVADLETKQARDLTPFPKARATIQKTSRKVRDEVLIGLNKRDPHYADLYRLDYRTGELTLVLENAGYGGFYADDDYRVRFAFKSRDDGGQDYLIARQDGAFAPWLVVAREDAMTTSIVGDAFEGGGVYMLSTRDRETSALYRVDVASGERTLLAEDAKADISHVFTDPLTHEPLAWSSNYERVHYYVLNESLRDDFAFLAKQFGEDWALNSRSEDDSLWIIGAASDVKPVRAYLYDRAAKSLTELYDGRPSLADAPLARMHPIVVKSRDGLNLVSYLTLPKGSDADHPGIPDKPLPLVLDVHGGPWSRVGFGFSAHAQWLANRGYASLSVNFRSSTGFGKSFANAGDGEWGRKMDDDLLDAVAYAIDHKIADPDRVAILGASYGGYATLIGMTRDPSSYACGVDTVGPSDLAQLLRTVPPYWAADRPKLIKALGDPSTPDGLALLKERSPLFQAIRIEKPLMVVQSEHDSRVVRAHADEIVDTLKGHHIPVTYVLVKNEGHVFARPENGVAVAALTENFLARCLGGRAEPIHVEEMKGATLEIPAGAELIDGYDAAAKGARATVR
jgi:dipeptidyl aminopeptidase/acylaminoacyl peptidase